MLSLYYKIWVDAIWVTRSDKVEGKNWKIFTIIPISILQGINLLTILLWIRGLSHRKFTVILPVQFFKVVPVNIAISLLLTFFFPFLLLNYLLMFSNDQYADIIKTYNASGGKRYFWYIGLTLGIFIVPYLLKWIF